MTTALSQLPPSTVTPPVDAGGALTSHDARPRTQPPAPIFTMTPRIDMTPSPRRLGQQRTPKLRRTHRRQVFGLTGAATSSVALPIDRRFPGREYGPVLDGDPRSRLP